MLNNIGMANKNSFSSVVNIRSSIFLAKYKSTCFIATNLKMTNILPVSCLCHFWNNCTFRLLCEKPILKVV